MYGRNGWTDECMVGWLDNGLVDGRLVNAGKQGRRQGIKERMDRWMNAGRSFDNLAEDPECSE